MGRKKFKVAYPFPVEMGSRTMVCVPLRTKTGSRRDVLMPAWQAMEIGKAMCALADNINRMDVREHQLGVAIDETPAKEATGGE